MKYSTSPPPSISGRSSLLSYTSRTQSPLPPPISSTCASATSKIHKFVRRLFKFQQMDFEYAAWQLAYLFYKPQQVYKNFNYRKQTKSQFARDDPAFLVLLIISFCITSLGKMTFLVSFLGKVNSNYFFLGFALVLRLGVGQTIFFLFYVAIVDCIFVGILVASLFWFIINRYMTNGVGEVEWGYAFDVHLNAFYPPLIILHFVQLFFYNAVINHEWFFSRFLGNSLWLLAVAYYVYITFLGYSCVPHVKNARFILVAVPIFFLFYVVSLIIGLNMCVTLMNFYHYRVL